MSILRHAHQHASVISCAAPQLRASEWLNLRSPRLSRLQRRSGPTPARCCEVGQMSELSNPGL
eukprot:4227026-Alexandrium_andersonii.AAC.1